VQTHARLDTLAAPPEIALSGELGVQGELEVGEPIERNARQHELLARRRHELGGVGDAIGLGDEPAGDRIAVDAPGDVFVHRGIIAQCGPRACSES
jgi:hypothetical protein